MILAPSVLSANWTKIPQELQLCKELGITQIHFDVMDGHFVPQITFGPKLIEDMRGHSDLFFDVHLMIENPQLCFAHFIDAGADAITFHIECTNFSYRLIQQIQGLNPNIKIGIALNPQTQVEKVLPIIHLVDIVLLMSVEPGFGGQKFIPGTLHKTAQLYEYRNAHSLNYRISIDGGVNLDTAKGIISNGADILVMGSAYFGNDDKHTLLASMHSLGKADG